MNKWFQLAVYSLIGLIITSFALSVIQGSGNQNSGTAYYYGPGNMGIHERNHMGYESQNYYNYR